MSSASQPGKDIKTLRRLVEHCHPTIFKEALGRWVRQCILPTVDFEELGIKHVSYSSQHVKAFSQPWACHPHLLLRSRMGTGKTTAAIVAITQIKPSSALIITPRQTLASSSMGVYRPALPRLVHYQESARAEDEPYLVCQLESLWQVGRAYEMVILDESESILAQFSSPTVDRFDDVTDNFVRVIQGASRTLWMDAFLADRSIMTCLRLVGDPAKMRYTENTYQSTHRVAKLVGRGNGARASIKSTLQMLANAGQKAVFVSASCLLLNEAKHLMPEPRLTITSHTGDRTKKKLSNANELFSAYHNIAFTGSLTVGVNFDVRDHFDVLVMYFSAASAVVRDMMQGSMRVRHLKQDTLYYATYPTYLGDIHFDVFNREKLLNIIEGKEEFQRNIQPSKDPMWTNRAHLAPWLRWLWAFNQQERNVSAFHQEKLLEEFLEYCGYTHEALSTENMMETIETLTVFRNVAYEDVPSVGHAEWEEALGRVQRGLASEEDKYIVTKYFLDHSLMNPHQQPTLQERHDLFNEFLVHQSEIVRRVRNLRYEHERLPRENEVFHENRDAKAHHIREICRALNVPHSQAVEATIDHVAMHKTCLEVQELKEALRVAFGLRFRESKTQPGVDMTTRRGMEILNGVLSNWGFTQIRKATKRKLVRLGGIRHDHTPYKIVIRGAGSSTEHSKNKLCLDYLDVNP